MNKNAQFSIKHTYPAYLLFSFFFLFSCSESLPPEPKEAAIIPQPTEIAASEGFFELTQKTAISIENERMQKVAQLFCDQFQKVAGWAPEIKIGGEEPINLTTNAALAEEAYTLISSTTGIEIQASTEAGFFYAFQTLKQLLPPNFSANSLQKDARWAIPIVNIKDQPRFGWRGFMLDVSRHFYTKEQVKEVIDQMAGLKLNTFHWHLTDDQGWRIEIKKYPKLTEIGAWRVDYNDEDWSHNRWWGRPKAKAGDKATYGGFYTQEAIREIVAYAQERFITVLPEIDVPGHAQAAIAAYPEVACHPGPYFVATGGAFRDNTLCPGKEITFEFIENVLHEVMDLFPSEYIHIGGDECNKEAWKVDPDCQARMKTEGLKDEKELQSYFIKRVEKIVNAKGKNLIGWDEILEGGLAPNATVMSWRGESGGIAAAEEGHNVIMTPNKFTYLDLKQGHTDHEPNLGYSQCLLSTCYNYNPIPEILKAKADYILGIQGNLWSESLPTWDMTTYMIYPRLFAVAENAWSQQEDENWDDFINRLYPQLERLQHQDIKYANSAFNVWIEHFSTDAKSIQINLHMEANGHQIKYTLDGSDPTMESTNYEGPFDLDKTSLVKAAAFRNGQMTGKVTQKQFFIHKAKGAKVIYHTPIHKNRNKEGKTALTDLKYGSNWTIDSLWQAFKSPEIELDVVLEASQEVSGIQMNFLQVAISGYYMPQHIEVLGSKDGKRFSPLGELSLLEASKVQGRYIQRPKIEFPATEVKALKIKAKTVNPIYKGHHLEGAQSTVFLDEIIVL